MWSKGRKLARDNIKALKEQFEASEDPIALTAFNPKTAHNEVYKNAFNTVKAGDPDYYDDSGVDEMMTELAQEKHVPWFQQAYDKYVEGQRFTSQIPGTRTYSGLTLGNRRQGTDFSALQQHVVNDQGRFLTEKQRTAGLKAPPVMYVPADEEDYFIRTGTLPKALAAHSAQADLTGIRVPHRMMILMQMYKVIL